MVPDLHATVTASVPNTEQNILQTDWNIYTQVNSDFTDRWDNSLKITPLVSGEDRSSPTSLGPGPGPFTTLLHELLLPLVSRVLTFRNPL